jgi:hypothetical protein
MDSYTPYQFLVIWPATIGGLHEERQVLIQHGERQSDAYRRLWQTIDDLRAKCQWVQAELPHAAPYIGPLQAGH